MSDHCISIVPKISQYLNKEEKIEEILDWLVSGDIVKPEITDCTLSEAGGYAVSSGAKGISDEPENLPFDLQVNGLEIISTRHFFHTGENGIDEVVCPNCNQNILTEDDLSFVEDWYETESLVTCPLCNQDTEINDLKTKPVLGFSDLGFTFWNWPDFSNSFIAEFRRRLGSDIALVHTWI
ncbi:MAG: hypothetical protein EOP48_06635 [Sphingobacteriales bacterium]|nr:MAG: hypothetical protein EOP48_06635 [Sphingobacteriales bacterium]